MKILVLTNSDMGLFKFRKELLQRLVKEGNKVFLSVPRGTYIPSLIKMGCTVLDIRMDRRGTDPWKDLVLLCRYVWMIHKIKPDVVLTYTIKPNIYGGIACRMLHVPYIVNITGTGTAIEKGGLLSNILLFLYKTALKNAAQIFFQNKQNQTFFVTKQIARKGRLIPGSGVDLLEHPYEDYPKEDGCTRFLFVGRIMKDKGIEEYLDCADKIGEKYANVYFSLIGGFDEASYQERIQQLEKKGRLKYFGPQDDVHSYMKSHHAVVLPSYHEGLSNVLLEAAACGRPVLATAVPGCLETYEDGVSGIGFPAKESAKLVKAVEKFLQMPYGERKDMGINGRHKVEKEFDRKIVVEAYMQEIIRCKKNLRENRREKGKKYL